MGPEMVAGLGPQELAAADRGLTSTEVAQRLGAGMVNVTKDRGARPLSQIIRANTITTFNLVIGVMWVAMLVTAPLQDSLFGFVIIINAGIGIVQEWRAARTLAKLSLLGAARPNVIRDGSEVSVASGEVVVDDLVLLTSGDQIVVDGPTLASQGMQVDESLLTGEADPVAKEVGDELLSGSFVVAGSGRMRAHLVGSNSYAGKLATSARVYAKPKSELLEVIMRFVRIMTILLIPVSIWLFVSQIRLGGGVRHAISGTVAGVVTMIPEGLVLLTSVAMAVSVVRLGRKRALVQEMPAVETLARVDVICVDKTGTLTEPGMSVQQIVDLREVRAATIALDQLDPLVAAALSGLVAGEANPNPTLAAVAAVPAVAAGVAVPDVQSGAAMADADTSSQVVATVPFASDRKWSAVQLAQHSRAPGWWVFGAPEMVCADIVDQHQAVLARASALAATGARVLLLAHAQHALDAASPVGDVCPIALVVISQTLRSDAAATVAYFADQGVAIKVISGDNPETVAAIAREAGIPGAQTAVDGRTLPTDLAALAEVLDANSVFGRVAPTQKQAMVGALQSRGHVVAMTGDGVNDVLALKLADLGIAMGSGAGATRSVAQIVLLDNKFSVMPSVVAEGRRVLGNIERVSDLFLNKSFYATTLALLTSVLMLPFPFLPRHMTVITFLTIGTPAFFLALMPNTERFRPGFMSRVLRLAVPSGIICAVAAMSCYGTVLRSFDAAVAAGEITAGEAVDQSRVAASITLFLAAWWVMVQVSRPLNLIRGLIVGAMAGGFLLVLYVPFLSEFFALSLGADRDGSLAVSFGLLAIAAITVARVISESPRWRGHPHSTRESQRRSAA